MRKLLILFAAGVLTSALAVAAADPPNRAARLGYVAGTVTFQPNGEETDWAPADLNRALTTGDKVWVEQGGRTEIQTVNSTIRLNGHTNFSFLTVDDTTTQIQLSLGVMIIRLRGLNENETYEVDTPQVAFTLLRAGVYRVEVDEAGLTSVLTVRGGDGETTADGKAAPLHVNEQVVIKGADNPSYDKHGAPNPDEFDSWCNERDNRVASSVSLKMVAPGVVGVTDLDVAGAWRPAPTYGNVWFPSAMAAGWAPYRFGHWGFVEPWGWTWIDDAPWGYAPFHYGRWVRVGGSWGWAPGPIAVRAIYAPALVSFIGGVEVVGVADPVSWVALSWGEPWYPSYGVSWGYYNSVNLCGTVFAAGVIAGVWGGAAVNLSFGHDPRAVVVVGRDGFAHGHPVGREFAHSDRFGGHSFDHAGARREGVRGIGASREGRFGGHAPLHAGSRGVPPRDAMGRPAVTRHAPAASGHAGSSFRGAGVPAKNGPSANNGHAGSFRPASNSARPAGGNASHNSTPAAGAKLGNASRNGTPGGGAKGGNAARNSSPAGGAKGRSGSPLRNSSPAGGAKGGNGSPSHNGTPAGGAARPAGSTGAASRNSAPAGGAKGGSGSPSRNSTPAGGKAARPPASPGAALHNSTPGGAKGGSGSPSRNSTPVGGNAARPAGSPGAATHTSIPAGGAGRPVGVGGGSAARTPVAGGASGARPPGGIGSTNHSSPVGGGGGRPGGMSGGGGGARQATPAARPAAQPPRQAAPAARPPAPSAPNKK